MAMTAASTPSITTQRARRLFRLLTLLSDHASLRTVITRQLKLDIRGFYRDLELLRSLGINITVSGKRYQLQGSLNDALAKLPFPDPGLNIQDAMNLAKGNTEAHRRLKQRLDAIIGNPTTPAAKKK